MELSTPSLAAELALIADNAEPGRTPQIAIRHWGRDGLDGATLEATGREFGGITRKRVAAQRFDPAGLLTAADILGREATFTIEVVKGIRVVLPDPADPTADTAAVIAAIVDTARTGARRGCPRPPDASPRRSRSGSTTTS